EADRRTSCDPRGIARRGPAPWSLGRVLPTRDPPVGERPRSEGLGDPSSTSGRAAEPWPWPGPRPRAPRPTTRAGRPAPTRFVVSLILLQDQGHAFQGQRLVHSIDGLALGRNDRSKPPRGNHMGRPFHPEREPPDERVPLTRRAP